MEDTNNIITSGLESDSKPNFTPDSKLNPDSESESTLTTTRYPQIIAVYSAMNLRDFHNISGKVTGRIPNYGKTQIEEVFQDGNDYWGRVGLSSWVCLKLGNQFFTSWRE